jgi:hypothetical protein
MPQRILVKLRSTVPLSLAASGVRLRPLFDESPVSPSAAIADRVPWQVAEIPEDVSPWDTAHNQVSRALGLDGSAILFAEPDLKQEPFAGFDQNPPAERAPALRGVPPSPPFGWHLEDAYSELRAAREKAEKNRIVRIAHLDTGYDPNHPACPQNILSALERSFVDDAGNPNSASDPNRRHLLDQSGHGTGTIGILAGRSINRGGFNDILGGAPDAEVLPIRVSNSVVLFWTSALAAGLRYAVDQNCDVVSLSMGGLPSKAWSETVNLAYESGVCIVAASGDCIFGLPTHYVVYPARYHRVIAACGVMSDSRPYYDLPPNLIEGNWGPDSSMTSAVASYTPNIPWAKFGTTDVDGDGAGTSAATPQIAAAAALWLQQHDPKLPEAWMKAEAVRQALFTSARALDPSHFGYGILKAAAALEQPLSRGLVKAPLDNDSFAFLRVLTGLGVAGPPSREAMFNLEITQRWLMNTDLQNAIPDPDAARPVPNKQLAQFFDAAIADPQASNALKAFLRERASNLLDAPLPAGPAPVSPSASSDRARPARLLLSRPIDVEPPVARRLRVYAFDPSLAVKTQTASINETTLNIKWEQNLGPGPVGEYIEVIDHDPASEAYYEPANLNHPNVLARDGFDPSEGDPRFHQQMVYAVTMKTISHFERALGRVAFWRPRPNPTNTMDDSGFVQRLRVYPHALRQANAYYSPDKIGLLFGYFQAQSDDPSVQLPSGTVFTCLSHDIIAHETTHALLDGMHRRFNEPSNPDVLAFHEAFADIVALFQHFTIPEVLESQIARTRGDLESESLLGGLALQFGLSTNGRNALRNAIGTIEVQPDGTKTWRKLVVTPSDYGKATGTHARGAVLVAAVFNAYVTIYNARVADLLRIYTNGTGVLPNGAIHPDLVKRLAREANKAAMHVLTMCIRALDYIPPVDLTFGDYLRGVITADLDLVQEDRYNYRIAFIEAFARRGIFPRDLHTLSVEGLCWQGLAVEDAPKPLINALILIEQYLNESRSLNRKGLFDLTHDYRAQLHGKLKQAFSSDPELAESLGLDPKLVNESSTPRLEFEVHSLRRSERVGPDGQRLPLIVLVLAQERPLELEGAPQPFPFRGGSTLILELGSRALKAQQFINIKYVITKRLVSQEREQRLRQYLTSAIRPLRETYFGPETREPFALLHDQAAMEDAR